MLVCKCIIALGLTIGYSFSRSRTMNSIFEGAVLSLKALRLDERAFAELEQHIKASQQREPPTSIRKITPEKQHTYRPLKVCERLKDFLHETPYTHAFLTLRSRARTRCERTFDSSFEETGEGTGHIQKMKCFDLKHDVLVPRPRPQSILKPVNLHDCLPKNCRTNRFNSKKISEAFGTFTEFFNTTLK